MHKYGYFEWHIFFISTPLTFSLKIQYNVFFLIKMNKSVFFLIKITQNVFYLSKLVTGLVMSNLITMKNKLYK